MRFDSKEVKQIAAELPDVQYPYSSVFNGDDVKDTLRINKAEDGTKVKREENYVVHRYNWQNHERAIKKIFKSSKTEEERKQRIKEYQTKVLENQALQLAKRNNNLSLRQRFVNWLENLYHKLNNHY